MARSDKAGRGRGKHSETARTDLARPAVVTLHGAHRFGLASEATLPGAHCFGLASEATLHGAHRFGPASQATLHGAHRFGLASEATLHGRPLVTNPTCS
jgi:hypothetical protein